MKFLISLSFICFLFLISCNKENEVKKPAENTIKTLTFDELFGNKMELPKEKVAVEGMVVHVCKHSGKKVFIVGKDPNNRFQIFAGDKLSGFPQDLEGSRVRFVGTLEEEKLDMKYIEEWEAEIAEGEKQKSKETKASCVFEDERKEVLDLRTKIAQSQKGYFSLFNMTALEYKKL